MDYEKYLINSFNEKIEAWENVTELEGCGDKVILNGIEMSLEGIMEGYITLLMMQKSQLEKKVIK